MGNNRPITWVTENDRSRESRTEVYVMAANATRAAKLIHKARSSAYGWTSTHPSFSSSFSSRFFSLSFLLLPLLPRPRQNRMNWMPSPIAIFVPALPPLLLRGIYVSLCNVHLPRFGERNITRSFFLYLYSCQLMSPSTTLPYYFSHIAAFFCLPPTLILYHPPFTRTRIDRWHELSQWIGLYCHRIFWRALDSSIFFEISSLIRKLPLLLSATIALFLK